MTDEWRYPGAWYLRRGNGVTSATGVDMELVCSFTAGFIGCY